MSATGRGAERRESDNYPTPEWCTEKFLDAWKAPSVCSFVEPACGEGAILKVLRRRFPEARIDASDIRDCETYATHNGALWIPSALDQLEGEWTTAISNPPYSLALEFAQWGVEHARYTALLLRLNFLEGQARSEWLSKHVPDVYVLSKRPSFTGKGTDATAYAWMVWHQQERTEGKVRILT